MVEMSQKEIVRLLDESRIGRLCMADADGRPYAIPLPFCYVDGALYLRIPDSGRKARILAGNSRVCFETDDFTPSLDDYGSVLLEGTLVLVTDLGEKAKVKAANTAKYQRLRNGQRPGHGRATPLEEVPLRKLLVESLSGRKKGAMSESSMAVANPLALTGVPHGASTAVILPCFGEGGRAHDQAQVSGHCAFARRALFHRRRGGVDG
jgi:uncharacterized protein